MFKNLDKVFKFTFKNQINTGGYKGFTIGMTIFLILAPVIIFLIADKVTSKNDDFGPCGADKIYVVNEATPNTDYNVFNMMGVDGYTDIKYINSETVDEALETIAEKKETKSLILQFATDEDGIADRIIIPDDSVIDEKGAKNVDKFLDKNEQMVAIIASGVSLTELGEIGMSTEYDIYNSTGFTEGASLMDDDEMAESQLNSEILPVFNMILIFLSIMVVYFMVLIYGNGINQSVVMEKSSKLMDTMLVSIQPQALIAGKILGVLAAAFLQIFAWLAGIGLGVFSAVKAIDIVHPESSFPATTFIKSFGELNLFRPVNVVIGILALLVGIILYSSLSAMCGSISATKEEAASNQGIFVMLLVVSFYLVLFFGMKQDIATWLYLIPFTGAMVLPAGICTGTVSIGIGIAGLLILVIVSTVFIILAGKLYVMMSLYKGNKVSLSKALKMLAGRA
ncbi:MAG: ABC transporter permease [Eubacterium sp.]|nr:ABC transporter permease [Eubacterium sp.]